MTFQTKQTNWDGGSIFKDGKKCGSFFFLVTWVTWYIITKDIFSMRGSVVDYIYIYIYIYINKFLAYKFM